MLAVPLFLVAVLLFMHATLPFAVQLWGALPPFGGNFDGIEGNTLHTEGYLGNAQRLIEAMC
eukprot:2757278-Rhodomonas_salina.1